jgi:hypothetical protein
MPPAKEFWKTVKTMTKNKPRKSRGLSKQI